MRVLMTVDGVGGVLTYATALIGGLRSLDPEVEVTVAGLGPALGHGARRRLAVAGAVEVIELGGALEWMHDQPTAVAAAAEALTELCAEQEPDLVHANCHLGAVRSPVTPGSPPVLLVAHSDVATWWRAVHGEALPAAWGDYRRMVDAALAGAASIVAPTAAHARALGAEYALTRPIDVIHNGLAAPAMTAPVPGPVTGRMPLAAPPPVKAAFALAAGRFDDAAKGLDTLIEAAAELSTPVLVAGPLPPGRRVGERIGPVRLLGRLDPRTLARFRAQAGAFVGPARYEPFGLAALEAAHDGCALVLSDLPGQRELWDGAACFVPVGDAAALAAELDRVLAPDGPAAELGARSRRRAARFGTAPMAAAYLRTYRSLLGHRAEVPA